MNRCAVRIAVFCVLLACMATAGWTQESAGVFTEFNPRIVGLDVRAGYAAPLLPDRLTAVSGMFGGAWGGKAYYRYPDDSLYPAGGDSAVDPAFRRVNLRWDVGVVQDLARSRSLELSPFLFYRGTRNYVLDDDAADELFLSSPRSDARGILENRFLTGLYLRNLNVDSPYKTVEGVYAETSIALAPAWLLNELVGAADYGRLNVTVKGFLPVFTAGTLDEPVLGAYLAGFYSLDYAYGDIVPHTVRSTLGGLEPRSALGGAVRGVDSQRFDASMKTVGNIEARLMFPGLLDPYLIPGLVLYLDGGYYLDAEQLSPHSEEHSDYALTTGAGLSVDFFGIATLVFYTQYYLTGSTVARSSPWTPFALGFGLHF